VLCERLGHYVHYFTLHGALRPFGASCVLAGYDQAETKECGLYMVEPSGSVYKYYGVATGKGKQIAKTELEKLNLHKESTSIDLKQAVKHVAKILVLLHKENKDTEGKPMELELSWISQETNWKHLPVPKQTVDDAKQWAIAQLAEEEEDDDDDDGEEEEETAAMEE